MAEIKDGKFGIRIIARPSQGFSCYCAGEFHSSDIAVGQILAPNETTYIDIKLHRFVDKNLFRFDNATDKRKSFKGTKPARDLR